MVGETANQILGHGTCVAAHTSHSAATEQAGLVSLSSSKQVFVRINLKTKIFRQIDCNLRNQSQVLSLKENLELTKTIINNGSPSSLLVTTDLSARFSFLLRLGNSWLIWSMELVLWPVVLSEQGSREKQMEADFLLNLGSGPI